MFYVNEKPEGKFLNTETIKLYVLYLSSVRDGRVSALKKAHNYALTCLDKFAVLVYDIHPLRKRKGTKKRGIECAVLVVFVSPGK